MEGNGLAGGLCPAGGQPERLRRGKHQTFNQAILNLVNHFPAGIPAAKAAKRSGTIIFEKPLLAVLILKISDVTI